MSYPIPRVFMGATRSIPYDFKIQWTLFKILADPFKILICPFKILAGCFKILDEWFKILAGCFTIVVLLLFTIVAKVLQDTICRSSRY
jgi:hypothetical protein